MKNLMIIGIIFLFTSCMATREKKSAKYYFKNEKSITGILQLYEKLYRTQPFSLGFSDRSFKYVEMDVKTDTVRYAMDIAESKKTFFSVVEKFRYDTVALGQLYKKMKEIKCIWLGKDNLYYTGKEESITFLSFKSALNGNPFLDRKYYMLVLVDPKFITPEVAREIEKNGYKKVKKNIYYTINGSFR